MDAREIPHNVAWCITYVAVGIAAPVLVLAANAAGRFSLPQPWASALVGSLALGGLAAAARRMIDAGISVGHRRWFAFAATLWALYVAAAFPAITAIRETTGFDRWFVGIIGGAFLLLLGSAIGNWVLRAAIVGYVRTGVRVGLDAWLSDGRA